MILLPPSPKRSFSLQDYLSLHPDFTMMLSKPLVSLVIAFAARSSVAAFTTVGYGNHADAATGSAAAYTTPVRRGFNGGYPLPSNPTTVNQCNGGSTVCCNTLTTAQDAGSALGGLPGLLPNANPNVGLTLQGTNTSAQQYQYALLPERPAGSVLPAF
ncbi:hypothetical protein BJV74DRAFT_888510 [Russula compacta]|nr:hypothetical protein BJV74DRAFT_888510 [Russula compacta]